MGFVGRGLPPFRPSRFRTMRHRAEPTNFAVQLVERLTDPIQHLVPAGRQTVHSRRLGPLGLRGTEPAALRHPRKHRVQRARTQPMAVPVQFLEHPLAVHALLVSVVENVDLPKGQEELADDGIAHGPVIIAQRFVIDNRLRRSSQDVFLKKRVTVRPVASE